MTAVTRGEISTSDGVTLRYLEAGTGEALLILPGLACTARGFEAQLDGLSRNHRVIVLDMRGHGTSDKPPHGYRMARFAADLRDALEGLDLGEVTLIGHSLGCVVIWSYLDLFDPDRIARLVLVDQPPILVRNPAWSEAENRIAGVRLSPNEAMAFTNRLATDPTATLRAFFGAMLTDSCPDDVRQRLFDESATLAGEHAAALTFDVMMADLRDVLPRIEVPTLYIGGEYNTVGLEAQHWICEQIPNATHVLFGAHEGGGHFMHLENPTRFNAVVAEFVSRPAD